MPLRFLGTGAKELPEEYRGRKRPQYSKTTNIAGCCPISIHGRQPRIELGLAFQGHFGPGEERVGRRGWLT